MRETAGAKRRAGAGIMLAATLACYLAGLASVLGLTYSLAALAAPGFRRHAASVSVYHEL